MSYIGNKINLNLKMNPVTQRFSEALIKTLSRIFDEVFLQEELPAFSR